MEKNHVETSRRSRLPPQSQGRRFHSSPQLSPEAEYLQYLIDADDRKRRLASISDLAQEHVADEIPNAEEISEFLSNQTSVEKQLQEQVKFYQNALANLKIKSVEIANENARLYTEMRRSAESKQPLLVDDDNTESDSHVEEESTGGMNGVVLNKQPKERLLRTKSEYVDQERKQSTISANQQSTDQIFTEQPNIDHTSHHVTEELDKMRKIYETKVRQLESLLSASKKQEEKTQDELVKLREEIRYFKTPVRESKNDVDAGATNSKIVEALTKEREELLDGINKLKQQAQYGKHREEEAYNQVKKSCELVQQAQLEKQEAMVKLQQTKKDMEESRKRYEKSVEEQIFKGNIESNKIKEEMKFSVEKLSTKLEEHVLTIQSLQAQVEKTAREKVSLKTELEKSKVAITMQKSEATTHVEEMQRELLAALKSKTLLEQDLYQMQLEGKQRQKKMQQEIDQLNIELKETQRRLQLAENSFDTSQGELLQVTNQLNKCKQELQTEILRRNMDTRKEEDMRKRSEYERAQKEQEYSYHLQEAENRYASTKEELTRLLDSQTQIVKKYKDECNMLAQKLSNEHSRNEGIVAQLTEKISLNEKQIQEYVHMLEEREKDSLELEKKLQHATEMQADYEEQVLILLNKQNSLLKDRHLLTKEIELLKNQTVTIS